MALQVCLEKTHVELKEWRAAYEHLSRTDLKPIILRLQPRLDPALAWSIS